MKMNPVGLVLSLVTALGVGLFALSKSTEDYTGVQNKEISTPVAFDNSLISKKNKLVLTWLKWTM